ncbi:ectoine hydroxylase-related dioxygenase (phytanoyl-CoA dioxygenase family) [Pseudoduganella flava]|nr:phytanoyl-CoA dioxygenase family protein [Pseudoduganella flava]TWI42511.1 ectoine hydroxylase-related dioxygenase (phytanoyl-CoA dioxygenase family) [Pseudoduganella flava]
MIAVLQSAHPLRHAASQIGYWRTLHPDLTITGRPLADTPALPVLTRADVGRLAADTVREGYFHAPQVIAPAYAARLARVVDNLVRNGIPPVFCLVYDEFWNMFAGLDPLLRALLGEGYRLLPADIWAWHVAPTEGASGWGPHRDLPRLDALRADGRPRVVNVWLPLTDAGPDNACMYVLPAHLDPNFPEHVDGGRFGLEDWQNIRALPAHAGSALGWNTQVLHWGGRCSARATAPRISVGIYFRSADCDLRRPAPDPARTGCAPLPFGPALALPFEARLEAIAGALDLYNKRIPSDFPTTWEAIFAFARRHRRGT